MFNNKLLSDEDKPFAPFGLCQRIQNRITYEELKSLFHLIPEEYFWRLVSIRLNSIPNISINLIHEREYWTEEYLIDQLYLKLASTRLVVKSEAKSITIYKYYNQALALFKWIPISKSNTTFVINYSDLTDRLTSELKCLDDLGKVYVLKRSVGRLFENINRRYYHMSIAKKLEVRIDR